MSTNHRAEFITIRHALGISQSEAANALDRSISWVRRIEQGQIPCPRYATLAMRYLREHPDAISGSGTS